MRKVPKHEARARPARIDGQTPPGSSGDRAETVSPNVWLEIGERVSSRKKETYGRVIRIHILSDQHPSVSIAEEASQAVLDVLAEHGVQSIEVYSDRNEGILSALIPAIRPGLILKDDAAAEIVGKSLENIRDIISAFEKIHDADRLKSEIEQAVSDISTKIKRKSLEIARAKIRSRERILEILREENEVAELVAEVVLEVMTERSMSGYERPGSILEALRKLGPKTILYS